jgi:hypothetical protein
MPKRTDRAFELLKFHSSFFLSFCLRLSLISQQHDAAKYDYWGLKKSILYTLFQAVKAITGGVTILKGQLIKGGGALAATLGKVISVKGDAVSNLGKKIVNSAALSHKKPSCKYHLTHILTLHPQLGSRGISYILTDDAA